MTPKQAVAQAIASGRYTKHDVDVLVQVYHEAREEGDHQRMGREHDGPR